MATTSENGVKPKLISGAQFLEVTVLVFGTALVVSGINGLFPSVLGAVVVWGIIVALIVAVNAVRRSRWKKGRQDAI